MSIFDKILGEAQERAEERRKMQNSEFMFQKLGRTQIRGEILKVVPQNAEIAYMQEHDTCDGFERRL